MTSSDRETSQAEGHSAERRRAQRWPLKAPYTSVRVTRTGDLADTLSGHAYDLSASGMRFELDTPLPVGEQVGLELVLFGEGRTRVQGEATVVRRHDADEVGPIRMAVAFTQVDREALNRYLAWRGQQKS